MARKKDNIKIEELSSMAKRDYVAEIMFMASEKQYGLDVANKVNHMAFERKLIPYLYFREAAEMLSLIILSRC